MAYGNFNDLYAQPGWKRNPQAAMQQYMQQRVQLADLGNQRQYRQDRMALQESGRQEESRQFSKRLDWFTEKSNKAREQQESMQMQRAQFQYGQGKERMRHRMYMQQEGELPDWQVYGGYGLQAAALPVNFAENKMMQNYYRNAMALQQQQMRYYGG